MGRSGQRPRDAARVDDSGGAGRAAAAAPRDRALLLRRTPYGETSLVIHALTARSGRVELIAKGAYRPKSRFYGVLDWFDTLELEWAAPRARGDRASAAPAGLGTLRAGDVATRRRGITRSLDAYRSAQTVIELLDLATRAGFADTDLFALGERGLDAFDDEPRGDPGGDMDATAGAVLATGKLAAFELQLLRTLGLSPSLRRCASCGQVAEPATPEGEEPRVYFSAQAGGRLCGKHASGAHDAGLRVGTLPLHVLDAASRLEGAALGQGMVLHGLDPRLAERVLDFAGRFLDHHLEARPKSHRQFLSAPDRNRRR